MTCADFMVLENVTFPAVCQYNVWSKNEITGMSMYEVWIHKLLWGSHYILTQMTHLLRAFYQKISPLFFFIFTWCALMCVNSHWIGSVCAFIDSTLFPLLTCEQKHSKMLRAAAMIEKQWKGQRLFVRMSDLFNHNECWGRQTLIKPSFTDR